MFHGYLYQILKYCKAAKIAAVIGGVQSPWKLDDCVEHCSAKKFFSPQNIQNIR